MSNKISLLLFMTLLKGVLEGFCCCYLYFYLFFYFGGFTSTVILLMFSFLGARCSSVVRVFAHGAMDRRIDLSCCGPIELFLVPASVP